MRLRNISQNHLWTVSVLIVFMCVVTFAFFFGEIPEIDARSVHCVQAHSEFSCYKRHAEVITRNFGARVALSDLRSLQSHDAMARSGCHQLAHVIGNTAVRGSGDIAEAFRDGEDLCFSGYYHGILEAYVGDRGIITYRKEANALCSSVGHASSSQVFAYYNCVHGLGHGVMALSHGKLYDALLLCDVLSGERERAWCYEGVFMENIASNNNDHGASAYLIWDQPLFPCTSVDERYKAACFKRQTAYAFSLNADLSELFLLCHSVADAYRNICFRSIGHDVVGEYIHDPKSAARACQEDRRPDEISECVAGAAETYLLFFNTNGNADAFCNLLPPSLKTSCSDAMQDEIRSMSNPPDAASRV